VVALSPAVGAVVWQGIISKSDMVSGMRSGGTVPILTRLVMEGLGGPISVARSLSGHGCLELAHAVGRDGQVAKILANMWVDLSGRIGRTHFPPPDGGGDPITVGRIFAEHVFSRLFAPPDQRKVLSLDLPGAPPVPPLRYPWREPEELLALPEGVGALDSAPAPVALPTVFSLGDTDSNQHVNSLVYPRIFEEAAVRRLHECGVATRALLLRGIEVAFRKPCFAGDVMRIVLQTFRWGSGYGAAVSLIPDSDANAGASAARPHTCARLYFGDGE